MNRYRILYRKTWLASADGKIDQDLTPTPTDINADRFEVDQNGVTFFRSDPDGHPVLWVPTDLIRFVKLMGDADAGDAR
jgi:hypothetical protein